MDPPRELWELILHDGRRAKDMAPVSTMFADIRKHHPDFVVPVYETPHSIPVGPQPPPSFIVHTTIDRIPLALTMRPYQYNYMLCVECGKRTSINGTLLSTQEHGDITFKRVWTCKHALIQPQPPEDPIYCPYILSHVPPPFRDLHGYISMWPGDICSACYKANP